MDIRENFDTRKREISEVFGLRVSMRELDNTECLTLSSWELLRETTSS